MDYDSEFPRWSYPAISKLDEVVGVFRREVVRTAKANSGKGVSITPRDVLEAAIVTHESRLDFAKEPTQ